MESRRKGRENMMKDNTKRPILLVTGSLIYEEIVILGGKLYEPAHFCPKNTNPARTA